MSQGSQSSANNSYRVEQVIAMFKGLKLPVTDDAAVIAKAGDDYYDYYRRMSLKADPDKRALAQAWMKNLDLLKNELDLLIDAVRAHFYGAADAVVDLSGTPTLTKKLSDHIQSIAVRQCQCEPGLAQRLVADYLADRGIREGSSLVHPQLPARLTAHSSLGQIETRWSLPPDECETVILRRVTLTSQDSLQDQGETLLTDVRTTGHVDRSVEPGQRYQYQLFAVYKDTESAGYVFDEAIAVGEIPDVKARWQVDYVRLSWKKPADDCEIVIFRATVPFGLDPGSTMIPLPDTPEASEIYRGGKKQFNDQDVLLDTTYYYLIVAMFEPGVFSGGVKLPYKTPLAPPPPAWVKADYVERGVSLEWAPVTSTQRIEYVVVRREGSLPPTTITDGSVIKEITQTAAEDKDISPGKRYAYTVFTRTIEIASQTGTSTGPVDILAEVKNLEAWSLDRTVELHFDLPTDAKWANVIVRRDDKPIVAPTEGEPVNLVAGVARDPDLQNGQDYYYRVFCAYSPTGDYEVITPGREIKAIPNPPPDPIEDFVLSTVGHEIEGTWTIPEHGEGFVVRMADRPQLAHLKRLPTSQLDALGDHLPSESGHFQDVEPNPEIPYYAIFSVLGVNAVYSGCLCRIVCPDVKNLSLISVENGVSLRWTWPPNSTTVHVLRCENSLPTGIDDPQATSIPVTLVDYQKNGGCFIDNFGGGNRHLHYMVIAQSTSKAELFFSHGSEPDCRAEIAWRPLMRLRYAWQWSTSLRNNSNLKLQWTVTDAFSDFAGFVLVANREHPPLSRIDGIELFSWQPQSGFADGDNEAIINLEPVQQRRWAEFYAKIFTVDPAQHYSTLVIHPNTTISLTAQGQPQYEQSDDTQKHYKPGVARTVICPYCFDNFPINKMIFEDPNGTEQTTVNYSRVDRMRNKPLRAPRTKQGKVMSRKRCPENKHILPYTAGQQESMFIGIIGAKFSGKSHYIASLLKILRERVTLDFQGALHPVTDETDERYQREFHDTLFRDQIELPVTFGTPPPLIYDLYRPRDQRGVTLALYDTAGENFDDPQTVRDMVSYLGVASGVVFLIDPLQSPLVRQMLTNATPLPDVTRMAEPSAVINRVLTELEHGKIVEEGGRLSTPVAVVLTKCDVLRDAGLIENNRLWNTNERHIGYFDQTIHDDMDGMMSEYIRHWSPQAYSTVKSRFKTHAFFGASATGCASDRKTHRYDYISPWRVEEPVLWLLAEMGVIPTQP